MAFLLYVLRMNQRAQKFPSVSSDRIGLLRNFLDIVESGSLSAAAERDGTSQPTVSRRLRALEESLGVRLLQRTTHAMKMTSDGERCYFRAKELLLEWDLFESELRGVASAPTGLLRVVVPHAFGQEKLVGPLATFLRRYPDVHVEWQLRDALPDFVASGIDCAIHLGEVRDPGLVAIPLVDITRVAVASPSLFPGRRLPSRPQELEAFPWLSLRGYYNNGIELRNLKSDKTCQISFRSRMGTDNLYALQHAAVLGLGICVASSWLLDDAVSRGDLVRLLPGWQAASMSVFLVYPYAKHYPARLRRFVELMKELVPKALDETSAPPSKRRVATFGG